MRRCRVGREAVLILNRPWPCVNFLAEFCSGFYLTCAPGIYIFSGWYLFTGSQFWSAVLGVMISILMGMCLMGEDGE